VQIKRIEIRKRFFDRAGRYVAVCNRDVRLKRARIALCRFGAPC